MNNYIQPGHVLTLTAPGGGVVSGQGVQIGQLFVVAAADAAATEPFEGQAVGVFTLPKNGAQAWTEGQLLYWTGTEVNTTATGNLLIGAAAEDVLAAPTTGPVRLNGIASAQLP